VSLTRREALRLAAPLVAANLAAPLTGLVDVTVVGRLGSAEDLAGVALGAVVFNALYWAAGFLRMGTTGLTAQAAGAEDPAQVRAQLERAAVLGAALGVGIVLLAWPLREAAFALLSGAPEVEAIGRAYVNARIAGAPAVLTGLAVYGWLVGLGQTRAAFLFQVATNLFNAGFSVLFVGALELPPAVGVGAASALSQWLGLGLAAVWIIRPLWAEHPGGGGLTLAGFRQLFAVNRDIFLRTLALLAGMIWFNEASAREGTAVLAGNALLLQLITLSAFFLDAFAYVTETAVGRAVGRGDVAALRRALRITGEWSLLFAASLSAIYALLGGPLLTVLTTDPTARDAALRYLPYCAAVPLVGMPSWLLDGLFIGATRGPTMRNAMAVSLLAYLALDAVLRPALGGDGLWLAFLAYYLLRALTQAVAYPALERDLAAARGRTRR
jgi:MATE family multidrug resistance protein